MKRKALLVLLALIGTSARAAVIDLTSTDRFRSGTVFFKVAVNGNNTDPPSHLEIRSSTSAVARLDDVADVGSLIDATVMHQVPYTMESWTRSFIVGPPNFPDPNPATETYAESLKINSLVFSSPIEFVSGTSSPIKLSGHSSFSFQSTVTLSFPESFTVSGVYTISGPRTQAVNPFTVTFHRESPTGDASGLVDGSIFVGSNYPATAGVSLRGPRFGIQRQYVPDMGTLFDGMVDGVRYRATFERNGLQAFRGVPEPASLTLTAVAVIAATLLRRQSSPQVVGP